MSRIRSVHPGFFTDENFVAVSMSARLLFIGLGVESDDKGIFEWKPLTIKMRIFPADHVMVEELLAELVNVNAICRYEIDGKAYGAIRNFRKFQRPKTPNDIYPTTAEILAFVGLTSETKAAKPAPFPPKGEKLFQMEDGGGRREEEKEEKSAYAFCGRVIRLKSSDYQRWQKAFADLDLNAMLQNRDDWLDGRPEADRAKWFQSTSSWLAKKQQAARVSPQLADPIC